MLPRRYLIIPSGDDHKSLIEKLRLQICLVDIRIVTDTVESR